MGAIILYLLEINCFIAIENSARELLMAITEQFSEYKENSNPS